MTTEPESTPSPRRPFQFTLRSLFALTTGTATFFALGRTLGYADAIVILVGIVITVGVMEWPRRICLPTAVLLIVAAGVLMWANLRTRVVARDFGVWNDKLDPFARSMLYRGWPIPPNMPGVLYSHYQATSCAVYVFLSCDVILTTAALWLLRQLSEFYFRRRGKPNIDTSPDRARSARVVD